MSAESSEDGFPWSIGVFDAHCHPTDTMSKVPDITNMKAKALIIMATRRQDQELVENATNGVELHADQAKDGSPGDWRGVVPSFGWHPWFSHHIFDDSNKAEFSEVKKLDREAKVAHYQSVLNPTSDDRDFLSSLPDPTPMSELISEIRARLEKHPLALIGEIGLDRSFRIPDAWLPDQAKSRDDSLTPGGREGRRLSPYRVAMEHQRKLLAAQLSLAGELQRGVSVHGVQAHGAVYDTLHESWKGHECEIRSKRDRKRRVSAANAHRIEMIESDTTFKSQGLPYPPRVCLHSYSGPPETLKQYLHPSVPVEIFFSFSTAINFSSSDASKTEEVIKALPAERILMESDLHEAGDRMDEHLKEIAIKICALRHWTLEEGLAQLACNWKAFVYG